MLFVQQLFVIYKNKQKHKTKLSDIKKWAHDLGLTDMSLHPDSSLTVWPQTDHLTSLNVHFHVSKAEKVILTFKVWCVKTEYGNPYMRRGQRCTGHAAGFPDFKKRKALWRTPTTKRRRDNRVRKTTIQSNN